MLDSFDDLPQYFFWPKHEKGEIDLIIKTDKAVIGIEVKYLSGLSSDDEVDNSLNEEKVESSNQLARYQDVLLSHAGNNDTPIALIFLAPTSMGVTVYQDVIDRQLINKNIVFGLLTWESVLKSLQILLLNMDMYP